MIAYPHLHVHSYYSLLGATPAPAALAERAVSEGMSHLALTDTNALYGAVEFDQACRAAGIQPIIGMTVTVAWGDTAPPGLLVLLAQNRAGYRSLCRLSARIQGHTDRDVRARRGLALNELRDHVDGLICLTGGRRGWAYRHLDANRIEDATAYLSKAGSIYGANQTYVSLEVHTEDDRHIARALASRAALLGLKTVALSSIYTLEPNDDQRLRLLAAIDRNCTLGQVPPTAMPDGDDPRVALHWPAPETMRERYAEFPEALAEAARIAARCTSAGVSRDDWPLPNAGVPAHDHTLYWPKLMLPKDQTPEAALRARATDECERRYGAPLAPEVESRMARELGAIIGHGYAPLFLVVADIVRYARAQEIPVSTRGSVANSLVAYALRITTVDPIAHGLLFERFLSPGRANPPDIDLDFCSRRRDEILAYVQRTYGQDRVALVGAMSTLRLRSAARETAKAYGLGPEQVRQVMAALPHRRHPRWGEARSENEVIAELSDPWLQQVARAAYSIAGVPHHLSVHAAGLVITPGPLTDLVPVQMAPKGYLTTQYNHGDAEAIGLPKLDLLGIRALTVLADAVERVRGDGQGEASCAPDAGADTASREPRTAYAPSTLRLDDIPLNDPATAELLAAGDTVGVFQCDSVGARRTLRKLEARTVQDLTVANAFFKPGPATGGQADVFVRRYRGEAPTHYLHPSLEPILASTKGVLIFQEQVLRVATEIAGLSWTQADHIRRGMSKMEAAEMAGLQTAFVAGCQRDGGPGLTRTQAEQLWAQVDAFSGYGFNQGHATAYADISYRSAYLKVHHPAAFFWARLRNYGGYHHPAIYMAEALQLGIDVRRPHVNHSGSTVNLAWEAEQPVLWLGLGLVRDLRQQVIRDLVRARARGPFADLRDLLMRVELQPKEVMHLIRCGALDGLGANRPTLLAEAEEVQRAGTAMQLTLGLGAPEQPAASFAQRLAWEQQLLGYPLGVLREWLPALRAAHSLGTTAADLSMTRGQVQLVGVRLPSWHRRGFALWDGDHWCLAASDPGVKPLPAWAPTIFKGRWRCDRWGMGWLGVTGWERAA